MFVDLTENIMSKELLEMIGKKPITDKDYEYFKQFKEIENKWVKEIEKKLEVITKEMVHEAAKEILLLWEEYKSNVLD
jgi:archaellum biogenesis protein FlaJ (TadC family)